MADYGNIPYNGNVQATIGYVVPFKTATPSLSTNIYRKITKFDNSGQIYFHAS